MKITSTITTDVDLEAVYSLCVPMNRNKCLAAIRNTVDFQIRQRSSIEGGGQYPDAELIAAELIEAGLASPVSA